VVWPKAPTVGATRIASELQIKIYLALRFPAVWPKAPTVGDGGGLQLLLAAAQVKSAWKILI